MADTNGKKKHVLLVDSQSELLEMDSYVDALKFVDILNTNSDSGWVYELVEIKKKTDT